MMTAATDVVLSIYVRA